MNVISGKIENNVILHEATDITGMIVGDLTVEGKTTIKISGMILGNLIVSEDCNVFVHGTINGSIINSGGNVIVYGTVDNIIDTFPDKKTIVNMGAIVRSAT